MSQPKMILYDYKALISGVYYINLHRLKQLSSVFQEIALDQPHWNRENGLHKHFSNYPSLL